MPDTIEDDYHTLDAMLTYGGGFAQKLARTAFAADPNNYRRIKAAFPDFWTRYKPAGERLKQTDGVMQAQDVTMVEVEALRLPRESGSLRDVDVMVGGAWRRVTVNRAGEEGVFAAAADIHNAPDAPKGGHA